jgi:hypothetical protein
MSLRMLTIRNQWQLPQSYAIILPVINNKKFGPILGPIDVFLKPNPIFS